MLVDRVERSRDGFIVHATDGRTWTATAVINSTGTWNAPFLPHYPGMELFAGRQLHTRNYRAASDFTGQRVLVVGGGASAAQFVMDLRRNDVETVWTTRGTPRWTHRFSVPDWGVSVEESVASSTRAGLPPLSVVAETGLDADGFYRPWITSGRLLSRGRLLRLTENGAVLDGPGPDGSTLVPQGVADELLSPEVLAGVPPLPGRPASDTPSAWEVPVDAVLWATGFRANLRHLRSLHLHEPGGGVLMADDDVTVQKVPGLFLIGYGPSASTIGATRAGRRAAGSAVKYSADAPRPDSVQA